MNNHCVAQYINQLYHVIQMDSQSKPKPFEKSVLEVKSRVRGKIYVNGSSEEFGSRVISSAMVNIPAGTKISLRYKIDTDELIAGGLITDDQAQGDYYLAHVISWGPMDGDIGRLDGYVNCWGQPIMLFDELKKFIKSYEKYPVISHTIVIDFNQCE